MVCTGENMISRHLLLGVVSCQTMLTYQKVSIQIVLQLEEVQTVSLLFKSLGNSERFDKLFQLNFESNSKLILTLLNIWKNPRMKANHG